MWSDFTLDPLTYFLHLNSYLVTFLHNKICRAQLFCPVSFRISFEHAVQLPFTVLLYSTFPDNYAFLSLSPSQIKTTQSPDTVPVHGHSPLVFIKRPARDACLCMGELQAPPAPPAPAALPAPHFVFLITL